MAGEGATQQVTGAFCPHCHLLVEPGAEPPWPSEPVRCPHCQLLIGAGRARDAPSGEPGAKGTAAGVFSRQARRDEGEERATDAEVLKAIVTVAGEAGERPERLLMVDYQQRSATDDDLPPLADVLEAFGSWKRARRKAAELAPPPAG